MGTALDDFGAAFPDGHRWLSAFKPCTLHRKLVATLGADPRATTGTG